MIATYIFGALSLVLCIVFCIFRSKKASVGSLALKTAASLAFVLCGLFGINATASNTATLLIIAGLVFGLVGDIVLDLKIMYPTQSNHYFVTGTSAFAIGHIFYFVATLLLNKVELPSHLLANILISLGVAVVLTLAIMLPSKKLGLNFGSMLWVCAGYSLMLTFMMAFAISIAIYIPIFWIFAAGMILFFLSDLVLSMQYFGGKTQKSLIYINHILYYLAQICIAISIFYIS